MAKKVFFIRSCPNSLVSSKPAVSIKTTGPIPLSSIALKTKSVVVPAISETSAWFCPVIAFKKADVGERYIIRLFNPTETAKTCKLCFYDKETTVSFGKYEIKTIRFDGNFSETDLMEGLLG